MSDVTFNIEFENNALLPALFGPDNLYLTLIEKAFDVNIQTRGNKLTITAVRKKDGNWATLVLRTLYKELEQKVEVGQAEVEAVIRLALEDPQDSQTPDRRVFSDLKIKTRLKDIYPYSTAQAEYIQQLLKNDLTLSIGPAGTGKTFLATAVGVSMFLKGEVERLILSRPAVEAGENLGFLPGDLKEKADPYLRPIYDALYEMLPADFVDKKIIAGEIEIAPLAYMRGRTLKHAYVILDEAQNTTVMQMKMLLTRLGEGSRMVVNGDITQIDLPKGVKSGLVDAMEVLRNVDGVSVTSFSDQDVVRHPLVARIVKAYQKRDEQPAS